MFKPSPVFWALTREGKRFGAGELIFPEIYQEELPGGAYYGDQLLDTSVVDSVQPANQQWKPYRQPVVIPITDIILNRGGSNNLDIIRAKFQTASGIVPPEALARPLAHLAAEHLARRRRSEFVGGFDHQHDRRHQPRVFGECLVAAGNCGRRRIGRPVLGYRRTRLPVRHLGL